MEKRSRSQSKQKIFITSEQNSGRRRACTVSPFRPRHPSAAGEGIGKLPLSFLAPAPQTLRPEHRASVFPQLSCLLRGVLKIEALDSCSGQLPRGCWCPVAVPVGGRGSPGQGLGRRPFAGEGRARTRRCLLEGRVDPDGLRG